MNDVADSKKSSSKPAATKPEKVKAKEVSESGSDDAFAEARQVLEDAGVSNEVLAGYDKFAKEFSPEALEEKSNEDAEAERLRKKQEALAREFDNL